MKFTFKIILINIVFFTLQLMVSGFTQFFGLTPALALSGSYWQFITYMFLHSPSYILHIAFNMFVLLIFGPSVEEALGGGRKFITLYLAAGIGSAIFHILLTGVSSTILIGASGSVFGILTAYAFLFPKNWIFIPPGIPMKGAYAVIILAAIEGFSGIFSLQSGIANFGHLGGIIVGVLAMLYLKHERARKEASQEFEFFWE